MGNKAKKYLGQHFLHEKGILKMIRDEINPTETDIIIEIGPGTGNLTAELIPLAGKVLAIEKDPDMISPILSLYSE